MKIEHKYKRIKDLLENDIRAGEFKNSKLPALKHLCEQYGTSVVTINKVVKLLEKEGLVTCYAGAKGTWINEPLPIAMPGVDEKNDPIDMSPFINKKVHLKYFNLDYSPQTKDIWEKISSLFSAKYPWIEVEMIPGYAHAETGDFDTLENIDVVQTGSQDLNTLKNNSKIMPLNAFLKRDPSISSKDFLPSLWNACQLDNDSMAVPVYFSVPLLYYRKNQTSTLQKHVSNGKDLSWEGFISIMGKVREGGADASLNIGLWTLWQSIFGSLDVKMFSAPEAEGKLCKLIHLIEQVVKKTKNRFDLIKVYQQRDIVKKFADGESELFCGYSSFLNQLKKTKAKDWRVSSMPLEPHYGQTTLMTTVNAISPQSRHKPEAWLFIRFLASECIQEILGDIYYFPARNKTLRDNILNQKNIDNKHQVLDYIYNGICWNLSSHSAFVVYNNFIYPALNEYLNNKIDMTELIIRIKTCYTEILPVYEII